MSAALNWLAERMFGLSGILIMLMIVWVLFAAGWCLANWHDPGLVTLKSLLPKADAASLQPPP